MYLGHNVKWHMELSFSGRYGLETGFDDSELTVF